MFNQTSKYEETIRRALEAGGPLTGSELVEATGANGLELWKACMSSEELLVQSIARYYMRLDRRVKGYARLSPSIYREFLTYSVIGTSEQAEEVETKARAIREHVEEVSRAKYHLAKSVISSLAAKLDTELPIHERLCVLIAGDIVFGMAHDVPRPERSTGRLVNGSDMDLVVIVDEQFPQDLRKRIDEATFSEKYRLLITPHIREEIDYVVKDLDKVREQLQFDTFKRMVACKIMDEGKLLFGNPAIFKQIKEMLERSGVKQKLLDLEKKAWQFRRQACRCLRAGWEDKDRHDILCLFYPTEESEEFE